VCKGLSAAAEAGYGDGVIFFFFNYFYFLICQGVVVSKPKESTLLIIFFHFWIGEKGRISKWGLKKKICCRKSKFSNSMSKDGKRRLLLTPGCHAAWLTRQPIARGARPLIWDTRGESGQDRDS